MELNIDYFQAIQGLTGFRTDKDAKVAEIQRQFADDFDSSIGVEYDVPRNDIPQDFIIAPSKDDGECSIFSRPGETFYLGDVLLWNGVHWIVTEKKHQNTIHAAGIILRANREIIWQNPKTKEIIKRWCIVSKRSFVGVDEGNVVSTLSGKIQIKLPFDNETLFVGTDKRFMLDIIDGIPMCYRLTFPDVNTYRCHDDQGGLIEWELVSDVFNCNTDNRELMLCDYTVANTIPPIPEPPANVLSCTITGRNDIRIGGMRRVYVAKFYDVDGVTELTTPVPVWELDAKENLTRYFKLSHTGLTAELVALDTEELIGEYITLRLTDASHTHKPYELRIECVVR